MLVAQGVSDFGDGVYALGLLWAMKTLTGSGTQVSLVLAAEMIPTIVIGLFAGVLVDYGRKKTFLLVADVARCLITLVLGILWMTDTIAPWHLIVAAALLSTFSTFFTPARMVAIRTLVPDEQMMKAQSLSQTVGTILGMCAPTVAALLIAWNQTSTFLFNSATFAVSFLVLLFLRHPALTEKREGTVRFREIKQGLAEGFRTIAKTPILRNMIVYLVLLNFMFAPIAVLFPLYADTAATLAVIQTVFSAGVLAGAVLVGYMGSWRKIVPICLGLSLILISFGIMSIAHGLYLTAACVLLLGLGSPITNITLSSLFVTTVPRDILGRAASMLRVMTQSASPISLSLTASLLIVFDVREMFIGIAVAGALIILAMLLNPTIRQAK